MLATTEALTVEPIDPLDPRALALLAEAAEQARKLYPELFNADSPAPTNTPLAAREFYLLARRDGHAVGCGALRCVDALTGEMRRMFVTRAARRAGVASALLAALESQARALGYRRLVLETGVRQKAAIALYKSAGWRRIPPFGAHAGDPTSVCFGKALD